MYRIRLHGRGGQGIKTAARLLGSALFGAGFEVQDAPLYGAERRGAPMSAFVRADRQPVLERGLITRPDLVVVADETLFAAAPASVLLGVSRDTVLLVRSELDAAIWRARLAARGPIVTLAPRFAFGAAASAGAAARLLGVISRPNLAEAVAAELGGFDPDLVAKNTECALAAFDAVAGHAALVREGRPIAAKGYAVPRWIEVPLDAPPRAAPHILVPASSARVRTGLWRAQRPQIDYALCNRCAWVCSTLCPDSAIRVRPNGAPEIDYDHCKGCLICVQVCPPHAIGLLPEQEAAA
jgi:pyruvate ferredoxin oxidoreductase gamma subunit